MCLEFHSSEIKKFSVHKRQDLSWTKNYKSMEEVKRYKFKIKKKFCVLSNKRPN